MNRERGDLGWASGLFLVALALRVLHLLTIRDSPFFSFLYIDPRMYDEWGQRIAAGQLLSEQPFFLDPLYPYFLGAVFALFGHHYEPVVAIQGLLGALVPPLVFLAALRWFERPVARLAGLIAVFYLPSIYFGGLIMKPGLSLFFVALALWLLARALDGDRWPTWAAAGTAVGLACLTRGNLILIVPILAVWILLRASPSAADRFVARAIDRSRWLQTGVFAVGVAVVLAVPAAHNYAVGGEWILSTANAGQNFYIGNNPSNSSGEYQQLTFVDPNPKHEQRDFAREARRRSGRPMSVRDVSGFWFGESLSWIRSEPLDWAGLMWRKFRSYWGAYEIPDSLDYYLYRERAPLLRLPLPGFGLLAPLALLGLVLALGRRGWPRLLAIFVVAYSLSVIVFFVFSRFRMVAVPALFVFAGCGAVEGVRRCRAALADRKRWLPAALAAGLFLVFFVFVNVPVRSRADGWSYRIAATLGLPTRLETSKLGRYNLGLAYAAAAKQRGDPAPLLALAEAELRAALPEGEPEHARVHVELGKVLARQQRNREAIDLYRQAAVLEPNDYRIHHSMGLLHRRLEEPQAAESAFRQALRVAPGSTASATKLGETLLELGKPEAAADLFRYVLSLNPDLLAAREGLRAAESP